MEMPYDNDISTGINLACESSFDSDAVLLANTAKNSSQRNVQISK